MWAVDGRKPSAGAKTFVKLKPRTSAKSVLWKADRAQRARDRLPRNTAAGDDTLRNRIEPMHRAKKDAAEAVGEAAGVCRHNESQRWLDMRVGSPEDCYRDPPVVPQPPTSSATEESEGAPPLTAGLAAHRPTKHPLEHLYKYKYKGDLLQASRQRARRLRQDFSLGHPPCGAGGYPLSVGNVAASRGTR